MAIVLISSIIATMAKLYLLSRPGSCGCMLSLVTHYMGLMDFLTFVPSPPPPSQLSVFRPFSRVPCTQVVGCYSSEFSNWSSTSLR